MRDQSGLFWNFIVMSSSNQALSNIRMTSLASSRISSAFFIAACQSLSFILIDLRGVLSFFWLGIGLTTASIYAKMIKTKVSAVSGLILAKLNNLGIIVYYVLRFVASATTPLTLVGSGSEGRFYFPDTVNKKDRITGCNPTVFLAKGT